MIETHEHVGEFKEWVKWSRTNSSAFLTFSGLLNTFFEFYVGAFFLR